MEIRPKTHTTMATTPVEPQLLSIARKDAQKVLEVYVKRSLSMNEGTRETVRSLGRGRSKNETVGKKTVKRSVSDTTEHLRPVLEEKHHMSTDSVHSVSTAEAETKAENSAEFERMQRKSIKKGKKTSSLFKNFISLFWRKGGDEKESELEEKPVSAPLNTPQAPSGCLPVSRQLSEEYYQPLKPQVAKPERKRSLKKTFSFKDKRQDGNNAQVKDKKHDENKAKPIKRPSFLALRGTPVKPPVRNVLPGESYYEKLSEEMVRIVKARESINVQADDVFEAESFIANDVEADGKPAHSDAFLIDQIVLLLQREGDRIDNKLKENVALSTFFKSLDYSSFQQLADRYVETEIRNQEAQGRIPELVKFAFTLDLTAKVAGICNHTVNRIMGFGNQYLQDRFTQYANSQPMDVNFTPAESIPSPD
ncbi:uncharacterized protein LOC120526252 isoform X1 [Polypterus senegalus]|uniref:uncharacterized protein LOC120526252 isoform X1 n=2 Tax=Polypterus senegalus TaxID=55291 RepID=UPI0019652108|nr:uncharacterized protein LOC120526252 isoform X1 [Polypterus senegalus]